MPENGTATAGTVTTYLYSIEARNGVVYPAKLHKVDGTMARVPDSEISRSIPRIVEIARKSFPHWTDKGDYFSKLLTERANRISTIYDPTGGAIIGFNVYEQDQVETEGLWEPVEFAYSHYAAIDPTPMSDGTTHRQNGLMSFSRTEDTRIMDADVNAGCSASGAILKGVRATAEKLNRQMYPRAGERVPRAIGNLAYAIYAAVDGPQDGATVNTDTLVRSSRTEYLRGNVTDPLQESLPTINDAILYVSLKSDLHSKLVKQ